MIKNHSLKRMIGFVLALSLVATLALGVVNTTTTKAAEDSITVDASFDDWDSVTKTKLTSGDFSEVALVWQGDRVYLYVKEAPGKNCSISSGQKFALTTPEGAKLDFTTYQKSWVWQEPTRSLDIRTNSYQQIDGAKGMGEYLTDNCYQWEMSFPASLIGDSPSSVSLTDASGKVLIANVKNESKPESTKKPEETKQPVVTASPTDKPQATKQPATSAEPLPNEKIIIDGYYDDWTNIDQDDAFTWRSNNTLCSHVGGIYMDDKNVYVHVKLHQYYLSQIPLQAMVLSVNGEKTIMFSALFMNEDHSIDWSSTNDLPEGITHMGLFYNEGSKPYLGDICVTIAPKETQTDASGQLIKNPTDEFEFAVDLATLSKLTGIPVESIKSVSFSDSNLGNDSITTSGTPTGAYIGIGLSILVVVAVLVVRSRRQEE